MATGQKRESPRIRAWSYHELCAACAARYSLSIRITAVPDAHYLPRLVPFLLLHQLKETLMHRLGRIGFLCFLAVAMMGTGWLIGRPGAVRADDAAKEDPAVKKARETVQMLDDLYKNAVVSITDHYVEQQSEAPAA